MSSWWVISLLVVLVLISTVNSKFDLDTPIRLAHCRATCLYKMKTTPPSDSQCKTSFFCSQCWKSCGVLQTTANSELHCRRKACGPGCLEACRFHTLSPIHVSPVPLEDVLVLNSSRVSWPPVSSPVVYVVMADGSQLSQTLESSVTLPSVEDPATVRVLVVDWRGLVKVFGPVTESPVDQALYILRSLGMEDKVAQASRSAFENDVTAMDNPINQIRVDNSWRINQLTLQHQPSLVLVQIGWQSYHNQLVRDNQLNMSYLVSWAADGDVVRGNLITNSSMVTLSLWPDTTYTIQVALFSLKYPAIQSEPLVLDTHQVLEPTLNTTSSQPITSRLPESLVRIDQAIGDPPLRTDPQRTRGGAAGAGREVVAGVSAAVIVFLGAVLAATWRWRHRLYLPHSKLLDEESDPPNIYRVFPPVMRLIGETDRSSDMFSSRDNLLQQHY